MIRFGGSKEGTHDCFQRKKARKEEIKAEIQKKRRNQGERKEKSKIFPRGEKLPPQKRKKKSFPREKGFSFQEAVLSISRGSTESFPGKVPSQRKLPRARAVRSAQGHRGRFFAPVQGTERALSNNRNQAHMAQRRRFGSRTENSRCISAADTYPACRSRKYRTDAKFRGYFKRFIWRASYVPRSNLDLYDAYSRAAHLALGEKQRNASMLRGSRLRNSSLQAQGLRR